MMAQALGGLDSGVGSREIDDNNAGSTEIFGAKFWMPHGMSEILSGLGLQRSHNGLFIQKPHQQRASQ
jgi:hypothetical protein